MPSTHLFQPALELQKRSPPNLPPPECNSSMHRLHHLSHHNLHRHHNLFHQLRQHHHDSHTSFTNFLSVSPSPLLLLRRKPSTSTNQPHQSTSPSTKLP